MDLSEKELIELCKILEPTYCSPQSGYQATNRLRKIVEDGHPYAHREI